jgi:hypothetical protein
MASILEMIQSNDLIKILLVLAGIYIFVTYFKKESLENVDDKVVQPADPVQATEAPVEQPKVDNIEKIIEPKQQLQSNDLLPHYDDANEFAKQNPVSNLLKEQNFLVSGYHSGVNTVMQSNKIAYHDIRSAPPIPKENVSPFLNSSYEQPAGTGRRMLEIL